MGPTSQVHLFEFYLSERYPHLCINNQYRNGKLFKVNIKAKKIIRAIFLCIIWKVLMHVIFEFVTCKIAP